MNRIKVLQQVIREHSQDHNQAYNAYILERVCDDGLRDMLRASQDGELDYTKLSDSTIQELEQLTKEFENSRKITVINGKNKT
ncbi:hypothetical protein [Epilithonimonas hominis]|uniref:hypothetical protein n=1 Tax=Epilithonimonas hominis TaxID=420404 RepID=UPI0028A15D3E|nr:hypothetical protein [Epilithonimonas hominis]